MKEEFKKYLKSIDITTKALLGRIEKLHDICFVLCPEDYDDIFVDETVDEEGSRIYECLNFYSAKHAISIANFITESRVHISRHLPNIESYSLTFENYDFKKPTRKSRLYLSYLTDGGVRGEFKASGKNCDALFAYLKKYLYPRLK